jgi:hypothetical protein
MKPQTLFTAAILLEYYVYRLDAANRLIGERAKNSVHYYKSQKGFYDGVAACLEALGDRCGVPSLQAKLNEASHQLRHTESHTEDPEHAPHVAQALVHVIGALSVASK